MLPFADSVRDPPVLLVLSARGDVTGAHAIRIPLGGAAAGAATVVIVALNAYLMWAAFN